VGVAYDLDAFEAAMAVDDWQKVDGDRWLSSWRGYSVTASEEYARRVFAETGRAPLSAEELPI